MLATGNKLLQLSTALGLPLWTEGNLPPVAHQLTTPCRLAHLSGLLPWPGVRQPDNLIGHLLGSPRAWGGRSMTTLIQVGVASTDNAALPTRCIC